jgi:hypothetical protein
VALVDAVARHHEHAVADDHGSAGGAVMRENAKFLNHVRAPAARPVGEALHRGADDLGAVADIVDAAVQNSGVGGNPLMGPVVDPARLELVVDR